MNGNKIETRQNNENAPFSVGDFIQDDQERIGEIMGTETIGGETLLKVKFAEHTGYYPIAKMEKT